MTTSADSRAMGEAAPAEDSSAQAAPPPLGELYRSVLALRDQVVSKGAATMALWKDSIHREQFRPGAENLANYLALRHHDLSGLQPSLSAYGLSSLGRSEARVRTALNALLATLARLAKDRLVETTGFFVDLVVARLLMRAVAGEELQALRNEAGKHVPLSVRFFLARRQSGLAAGQA